MPIGDRYDGVNMTTFDGVLRRLINQEKQLRLSTRVQESWVIFGGWLSFAMHSLFQHHCLGPTFVRLLIL